MGNKQCSKMELPEIVRDAVDSNDGTNPQDPTSASAEPAIVAVSATNNHNHHQTPPNRQITARKRSNLLLLFRFGMSSRGVDLDSAAYASPSPSHPSLTTTSNGQAVTARSTTTTSPPRQQPPEDGYYDHAHDNVMVHFEEAKKVKRIKNPPRKSQKWSTAPMGVVGLRNLGNTCFINSSLQCLSNTIPLTDYFLGYDFRSEINKSNVLGTGGRLVTTYAELIKEMWLGNKSLVEPSAFKRELGTFAPRFGGYRQHDAQELLAFLLDGIHEDLNRVQQKPYIEDRDCDGTQDEIDAILAWKNYLRRNKSLVVDLFQGQLRNTCQCLKCKHKNIRFEPFMYLSLPISNDCRTLQDCMELYLTTEVLRGTNQWYCEKCKTHRDATKKIDLWILPPILIVHLKRFTHQGSVGSSHGSGSKNGANVAYPSKQWDLSKVVLSKAGDPAIYDLYAVSNHLGSLGGGHYTAHALNRFDDQWYEFNDSQFRVIPQDTTKVENNPAAYVLFYNRVTVDQSSPTEPVFAAAAASSDGPHVRALGRRRPYLPLIRRQSVSRPDLWPHTQVTGPHFRDFRRSSVRGQFMSLSPIRKPTTTTTKDIAKHAPAAPLLQKERCATT